MSLDDYHFTDVQVEPSAWMRWAKRLLGVPTDEDEARIRASLNSHARDRSVSIRTLAAEADLSPEPASRDHPNVVRVVMVIDHLKDSGYVKCIGCGDLLYGWNDVMLTPLGRTRMR